MMAACTPSSSYNRDRKAHELTLFTIWPCIEKVCPLMRYKAFLESFKKRKKEVPDSWFNCRNIWIISSPKTLLCSRPRCPILYLRSPLGAFYFFSHFSMPHFHSQITQSQHFSPIIVLLLSLYSSNQPWTVCATCSSRLFSQWMLGSQDSKTKRILSNHLFNFLFTNEVRRRGVLSLLLANSDLI